MSGMEYFKFCLILAANMRETIPGANVIMVIIQLDILKGLNNLWTPEKPSDIQTPP